MKKAKIFAGITLLSGVALTLAACGNSESNSNESSTAAKFSSAVPKKATKNGGTVKVAVETDTPFTGIFNDELSTSATDTGVMQYGAESLFATDDQYVFTDKGAATIKINQKAKTATINIKKNVKWSDGKPVTAKDYEYAYEIIANKATKSQRYTSSLADLVGLEEYHEGKSNTISGIEMPDGDNGRKVILHFKTMKPGMNTSGNGYIWGTAAPYHYLKDVKFKDLMSRHKNIRFVSLVGVDLGGNATDEKIPIEFLMSNAAPIANSTVSAKTLPTTGINDAVANFAVRKVNPSATPPVTP